jgi:hypothetical protein
VVDTLFERLDRYLMIKKVQALVAPNVIGENFAIYRACCNYVTIRPDKQAFLIDEAGETFEALSSPADKCAGDYIKKQVRAPEPEVEKDPPSTTNIADENLSPSKAGTKKIKRAMQKMALALIGGAHKE